MTKPTKKSKKPSTSKQTKEQLFVDSLDLHTMWEAFSLEIGSDGFHKFKTVWQFVTKHNKVVWERECLYWLIGPKVVGNAASPYKDFPQQDWLSRRNAGSWFSDDSLNGLKHELKSKQHALEKVAELGNMNVDILADLRNIQSRLMTEFAAGIMLPNATLKENAQRANLFMSLQQAMINMVQQAQEMYGKTQGLDLQRLSDFFQTFAGGMGQAAGFGASMGLFKQPQLDDGSKNGLKTISQQLTEMLMDKAVNYELPLPTQEMADIVINGSKPKLVKGK